jgi:site-specific recombinase XerD
MKWLRLHFINGIGNEDYIPRNLVTVRTTADESVEVYSIKKVTPEDLGVYRCEITEKSGKRTTQARVLQVKRKYYRVAQKKVYAFDFVQRKNYKCYVPQINVILSRKA